MSARIPYRLPVLPPELSTPVQGWTPKESFSASQLANYAGEDGCKRKWAWGNCFGAWSLKKSIAALLGSLVHGSLEHYLRGGTVYDLTGPNGELRLDKRTLKEFQEQIDRGYLTLERLKELVETAPPRALAGIVHLPKPGEQGVEIVQVERWLELDTRRILGGVEPIKISGKVDLSVRRVGVWYLYDHKSTKGKPKDPWAHVKSPEMLRRDPQAVLYAAEMMLRHNLDSLWIRWIYYLTDTKQHPLAKPVDFEMTREETLAAAYQWLLAAHEMRGHIRAATRGELHPTDLPANTAACESYGGCPYHFSKGGPCSPEGEVQLGSLIMTGQRPGKKEKEMALSTLVAQTQAAAAAVTAGQAPAIPGAVPFVPPEAAAAALAPLPQPYFYDAKQQVCFKATDGNVYLAGPETLQQIAQFQASQAAAAAPAGAPAAAVAPVVPPAVVAPIVPPAVVAPVVPGAATTAAPPVGPGSGADVAAPEGAGRRSGRPKGSRNKPKDDELDTFALLVEASLKEGNPLGDCTSKQLRAAADAIDANAA